MRQKDELIARLIESIAQRTDKEDALALPDWRAADWELLLEDAQVVELGNSEILIRQDETGNGLYFLVEGQLEVSVPQLGSMSMTPIVTIAPGSIVGEIAFLDNHARSASVWSRGDSVVLLLSEPAFRNFRATQPTLCCDLLFAIGRIMAQRLRRSQGAPKGGDYF